MQDILTILIFVFLGVFFINLLPFLIPLAIIVMVINHFRRQRIYREYEKNAQNTQQFYDYDHQQSTYQTQGNIKSDVIDVEYEETVEK